MTKATKLMKKRHRRETRFRFYGFATIFVVLTLLGLILGSIIIKGSSVFRKAYFSVEIEFSPDVIHYDPQHPDESLREADFRALIFKAMTKSSYLTNMPEKEVHQLISPGAEGILFDELKISPQLIGQKQTMWLLASDDVDYFLKHPRIQTLPQMERRLNDEQIQFLLKEQAEGRLIRKFNWYFFTDGDSRSPELAGIKSAVMGSLLTILVTLLLAFPFGIAAAVYIEEFAPSNRLVHFLELNINNLASVPSIVFGLLGLAVFINIMHMPRSSPLVGGMTLALMIMPVIFIATRSALHTVPKSIARAAEALGASPVQVVFHHKIPLALPGILTGTILGVARALGESAALLMVGMVAFVVDSPTSVKDPATVLPVLIFSWSRNPEQGFEDHTAAAIMILLLFLVAFNYSAIYIRKKFEHHW